MKMIRFILATLSLSWAFLDVVFAQEENVTVQSGEAQYNGEEVFLIGNVVVQHELGQLSSQQMTLIPAPKDKKIRFSSLKMQQHVQIQSKDSGKLHCQEAEIDYQNLKGQFLGNSEHPDVVYMNDNSPTSLHLRSYRMDVELIRDYQAQTKNYNSSFRRVQATGSVRAIYNRHYVVRGDYAVYERKIEEQSSHPIETILIHAKESDKARCHIQGPNGDEIQADIIRMDLINRQMDLEQAKGVLNFIQDGQQIKQPIHFSCDHLKWLEHDHVLILQGHVELFQEGLGDVKTEHEIRIYQNGKKGIQSIVSEQETELTYLNNQETNQAYKVICHGPLVIDHDRMQIWMRSLANEQKDFQLKDQVYFENMAGELYANEVLVNYQWENKKILPHHLLLHGHVKIINRFNGHLQESSTILQYALADQVDYFPKTQEMVLVAEAPHRVLLFDRVNQLQMSAPSLKIRHDEQTKKPRFEGIGDVRFTFIKQEFDQLKEQFSLDDSMQ